MNVLDVEQLPEFPTGCEITAVTMMLKYTGAQVNKEDLADQMPYHLWNPSEGYVGNPYTTDGWTIYPSALTRIVEIHAGNAENVIGGTLGSLESELSSNKPFLL